MPNQPREPIVAIDGPAGSGKSTVAKLTAHRTGLRFISSGAMYRAVALLALRTGVPATDRVQLIALAASIQMIFTTDADGREQSWLGADDVTEALRDPAVAQIASVIATMPEVRAELVAKQQAYGRDGGVIMEGRDIQTVVFPNAEIKVFLTASAEERARRRWQEQRAAGLSIDYSTVLHEVQARDERDTERAASPLRAASDAIAIDTDGRTVAQVVDGLARLIDTWRAHPALRGAALAHAAGGK